MQSVRTMQYLKCKYLKFDRTKNSNIQTETVMCPENIGMMMGCSEKGSNCINIMKKLRWVMRILEAIWHEVINNSNYCELTSVVKEKQNSSRNLKRNRRMQLTNEIQGSRVTRSNYMARRSIEKSKWRRVHGADNFRYVRVFVVIFRA